MTQCLKPKVIVAFLISFLRNLQFQFSFLPTICTGDSVRSQWGQKGSGMTRSCSGSDLITSYMFSCLNQLILIQKAIAYSLSLVTYITGRICFLKSSTHLDGGITSLCSYAPCNNYFVQLVSFNSLIPLLTKTIFISDIQGVDTAEVTCKRILSLLLASAGSHQPNAKPNIVRIM